MMKSSLLMLPSALLVPNVTITRRGFILAMASGMVYWVLSSLKATHLVLTADCTPMPS